MDLGNFLGMRMTSAELESALGSNVASRVMVHEWPLSSTERVDLADGRRFAYKAQRAPSVECAFYASVRSPLLVDSVPLVEMSGTQHLATAWIDAPNLRTWAERTPQPERIREYVADVSAEINQIDASAPVLMDVRARNWVPLIADTLAALTGHIESGQYSRLDGRAVDTLELWSRSAPVLRLLDAEPVIVHGDLTPDEVFVTDAGPRVIDWQRPILGPAGLDRIGLLRGLGTDTEPDVPQELLQMERFVLLRWGVTVARDFVPGRAADTEPWVELAIRSMTPDGSAE